MKIDNKVIEESFRSFWKENKDSFKFLYKGHQVKPEELSLNGIQLEEVKDDEYIFSCKMLNLRVQIGCCEESYNGECSLKVVTKQLKENAKPIEIIDSVIDNTIFLTKI